MAKCCKCGYEWLKSEFDEMCPECEERIFSNKLYLRSRVVKAIKQEDNNSYSCEILRECLNFLDQTEKEG